MTNRKPDSIKRTAIKFIFANGALVALLALAGIWALGCATPAAISETFPMITPSVEESTPLRLAAGDTVEIKFRYTPDLDDTQTVRPDGKITLPEVDDVQALGLTPAELDAQLSELYATKLKDPVITVIVRALADRRVYIGGEVIIPGEVPMIGRMTVLGAIMSAGGFDKLSAETSNVVIVRYKDGNRYAAMVDLSTKSIRQVESAPFYLAPNDIVFVPRTKIDVAAQWVDDHFNRLIPEGFRYTQPGKVGGSTIGYTVPDSRSR